VGNVCADAGAQNAHSEATTAMVNLNFIAAPLLLVAVSRAKPGDVLSRLS
jgi:hypothetical protein